MDPQGSWNGSSFTIVVNDTIPRFFHGLTPWFSRDCSGLASLSGPAAFPETVDELFALNPVISCF